MTFLLELVDSTSSERWTLNPMVVGSNPSQPVFQLGDLYNKVRE